MTRILMVEDDQSIAKNLELLLQSEQFSVIHAKNREEADRLIAKKNYDLALIDISLPDGNGFSVYTQVKKNSDIPAIFLTASSDEASVITGLEMGAYDYITKPFRPRELIARIKVALRKHGKGLSVFEIGDVQVDIANGTVKKKGNEIFLTALEYRLLLVFINHPKSIITRSQLLDELWDAAGEFVNDNTLTVYIKRLREKIEDDPSEPSVILTVRGVGYRLGESYVSK